jgi:hypothetical protein
MAECYFCGKRVSQAEAVEVGWVPEFHQRDGEHAEGEACPACATARLSTGPDGELYINDPEPVVAEAVRVVATKFFRFPLETRGSDSLDFHDVAVWQLRDALTAAYQAGRASKS